MSLHALLNFPTVSVLHNIHSGEGERPLSGIEADSAPICSYQCRGNDEQDRDFARRRIVFRQAGSFGAGQAPNSPFYLAILRNTTRVPITYVLSRTNFLFMKLA